MHNKKGIFNFWLIIIVAAIGVAIVIAYSVFQTNKIEAPSLIPSVPAVDQQVKNLNTLSSSDEVDAIQNDLDATDLDQLDQELPDAESEASSL